MTILPQVTESKVLVKSEYLLSDIVTAHGHLFALSLVTKSELIDELALAKSRSLAIVQKLFEPSLNAKALPLEWLLDPDKKGSYTDRVLARLIQAEAHEQNPHLRDDLRQAWITVRLAAQNHLQPFTESSYRCYGCHPDKVWSHIVADRQAMLGPEYESWYDANGNRTHEPMEEAPCTDKLSDPSGVGGNAARSNARTTRITSPTVLQPLLMKDSTPPSEIARNGKSGNSTGFVSTNTTTPQSQPNSSISANSGKDKLEPDSLPSPAKKPSQSVPRSSEEKSA